MPSHPRHLLKVSITAACAVLAPLTVSAQDIDLGGPTEADLNVQNFSPAPSPYGIFSVDSAQGSANLAVSGGLLLNFAKDPLVVVVGDQDPQSIVEQQLAADVLFSIGLFDVLELGLDLPVYLVNTAEVGGNAIDGATVGDLLIRPKFTILNPESSPVGLALYANVGLPTGDAEAFTSSGTVSVRPGLVLDTKVEKLLLAANLGANIEDERDFGNLSVGSELTFGFGAQYSVTDSFLLGGEIFGKTGFEDFFKSEETPLEGLLGLKYRTDLGLNFEVGAGGGLVPGYGAPAFRVIGGLRYANFDNDWDDDGILNNVDVCARDAEDKDLFKDEDGCPEPDNDEDLILDKDDSCPNDAEDKDEFEDADGCPDPDNDKDGVADVSDKCPMVAGVIEFEGCPTPDRDGDKIMDDKDKCPDDPEDRDTFQDEDGCPDPDNDGDLILDKDDKCPNTAEDKDNFKDEDGCPEPDNDGDSILDKDDKCPNEMEILNGFQDEDGCPDKGDPIVTKDLKLLQKVYFDTAKATIKAKSFPLLNAVALVLKGNPDIKLVDIQGHTDDVGDDGANMKLSNDRANSVMDYLVKKGIDPKRLKAKGYGETKPEKEIKGLKGRALDEAREANRRVQFEILERDTQGN